MHNAINPTIGIINRPNTIFPYDRSPLQRTTNTMIHSTAKLNAN